MISQEDNNSNNDADYENPINSKNSNSEEDLIEENIINKDFVKFDDNYRFGWSTYSEITNGRFAMIGFITIILIEVLSKQSFLVWAGIS